MDAEIPYTHTHTRLREYHGKGNGENVRAETRSQVLWNNVVQAQHDTITINSQKL